MIEKTYLFEEICEYLINNIDIVFFGVGTDERDKYLKNILFPVKKEKCFSFKYDVENEQFTINESKEKYYLKKDFPTILEKLYLSLGKKILIDITSLSVPMMFNIIKVLTEIKPEKVLCAYTKPKDYRKKDKYYSYKEHYELSEKFTGIKTLPGFLRSDRSDREQMLILFLGYEGRRAWYIYEEEMPASNSTIPIIGLPGYQAGWHYNAFESNLDFIRDSSSIDFIEYAAADSPFEAYDILVKLQERYDNKYFVIAPIGTKVHGLGVSLFSVNYPDKCTIVYDNPILKEMRSIGVDSCLVYDITELLMR